MKFNNIWKIWKELEKTKKMPPTGTFFDYLFRNGSQLKLGVSKQRVTTFRIRISYGHKMIDSLDGTLQTLALIKIKKIHNA
jgi:hypothetical protein